VPASPVLRTGRRYLRLSVRGLIVLVLVVGVWLGWLVCGARVQREAVAAIKEAGGWVEYDWERGDAHGMLGTPWAPQWLVDLVGVDYFGHVTLSRIASDSELVQIGRLTRLRTLYLDGSFIGDDGLAHLKGLKDLSFLDLGETQVTDSGLAHLKWLESLSALSLRCTQVSDAGVAHLSRLTNLSGLDLGNTQVSDAGLMHPKPLTNLSGLNLRGTQVTGTGLAHFKGLTKLQRLVLSGAQVTDAGASELKPALPGVEINR
jgi:hypothetical protein